MHAPDLLRLNNDSLFLTYCKAYNEPFHKDRIVYGKVFNPSLNWDERPEKIIYQPVCINQDMGYPTSVVTDDNCILTIYYQSGCKNIIGGTLSELDYWEIDPESLLDYKTTSAILNIIIYPIPTSDFLNVYNPENKILEVEMYDLNGLRISEYFTDSGDLKVDLNSKPSGFYFLKVTADKMNKTFKVIKK